MTSVLYSMSTFGSEPVVASLLWKGLHQPLPNPSTINPLRSWDLNSGTLSPRVSHQLHLSNPSNPDWLPILGALFLIYHQYQGILHLTPTHYWTGKWAAYNRWSSGIFYRSLQEVQEVGTIWYMGQETPIFISCVFFNLSFNLWNSESNTISDKIPTKN